jgi:hypothetical protein
MALITRLIGRLNTRAAKLLREVVGVGDAGETPADEFLIITPLPSPAPALDATQTMKRFEFI